MDRGKENQCFQFLSLNQLGAEPHASYRFFGYFILGQMTVLQGSLMWEVIVYYARFVTSANTGTGLN